MITLAAAKPAIRRMTISAKTLVTAIVAGTSVLQIQEVRDFAIKNTLKHPHISSLLLGVTAVLLVLHNPQVQKLLHIQQQENIQLKDGSTAAVSMDTTAEIK